MRRFTIEQCKFNKIFFSLSYRNFSFRSKLHKSVKTLNVKPIILENPNTVKDEFKEIHREEIPFKNIIKSSLNKNIDKVKYHSLKNTKMFGFSDRDNVFNKKRLKR